MKFKITKTAYAKLTDDMKGEYEGDDAKGYTLVVEGMPEDDAAELKNALKREKERADNLKEEVTELTTEVTTLKAGQTNTDKDIAKVTARHERKLGETTAAFEERINKLRKSTGDDKITATANALAADISTAPAVMLPHITSRLLVEWGDDDVPVLKVTKDGKPSDLKVDDLKKELVDNKAFASIIRGTRSSGGAAPANGNPLNPGATGSEAKPKDLVSMDRKSFTDTIREKREAAKQTA